MMMCLCMYFLGGYDADRMESTGTNITIKPSVHDTSHVDPVGLRLLVASLKGLISTIGMTMSITNSQQL